MLGKTKQSARLRSKQSAKPKSKQSAKPRSKQSARPRSKQSPRGVVYFSHLPHGFYEDQIKTYCSQFGHVTGVYLPKSKVGNYRGYGFVEFKHPEVAEIVADTMNNYLMFNRLVKAKYISPEQQRPWAFKRPLRSNAELNVRIQEGVLNRTKELNPEQEQEYHKKVQNKIQSYQKKLKSINLDYEFQIGLPQ